MKALNDIKVFVQYACIRDTKLLSVKGCPRLAAPTTHIKDIRVPRGRKRKHPNVYYATNKIDQAQYFALHAEGISVALFDKVLDTLYSDARGRKVNAH